MCVSILDTVVPFAQGDFPKRVYEGYMSLVSTVKEVWRGFLSLMKFFKPCFECLSISKRRVENLGLDSDVEQLKESLPRLLKPHSKTVSVNLKKLKNSYKSDGYAQVQKELVRVAFEFNGITVEPSQSSQKEGFLASLKSWMNCFFGLDQEKIECTLPFTGAQIFSGLKPDEVPIPLEVINTIKQIAAEGENYSSEQKQATIKIAMSHDHLLVDAVSPYELMIDGKSSIMTHSVIMRVDKDCNAVFKTTMKVEEVEVVELNADTPNPC
jgi:hypothetical protein